MSSFANRMIRAAKLDVNLYEEVEADKQAMGQAMGVVVLASLAAGIGSVGTTGTSGLLLGTIIFVVCGIWMLVAMIIAVRQVLDYKSTWRAVGVCFIGWIIQGVLFWIVFSLIK